MKNKLSFLYQNGRMVHFGMYLRNQIFRDDSLKKNYRKKYNMKKTLLYLKIQLNFMQEE
jgi:hypothetical protein